MQLYINGAGRLNLGVPWKEDGYGNETRAWSSTIASYKTNAAWTVNLATGNTYYADRGNSGAYFNSDAKILICVRN
jgi:hypothetical protein